MKRFASKILFVFLAYLSVLTLCSFHSPADAYRVGMRRSGHNCIGTKVDGSLVVSTNTTISAAAGCPLILQYDDLTINTGITLTLKSSVGVFVYVYDDFVNNGVLRALTDGSRASPAEGIHLVYYANSSGNKGAMTIVATPATGGAGASGPSANAVGVNGGTVANGTGGGGSGAKGGTNGGTSGNGAAGTVWGGGSGGAGSGDSQGGHGAANCGAGGDATVAGVRSAGGGAGNPGGAGATNGGGGTGNAGSDGTGAFLAVFVGDTISGNGVIHSDGQPGGSASHSGATSTSGGGGSGAGNARVYCKVDSYTGSGGTVRANGGAGGTGSLAGSNRAGGNGGAGTASGPTVIAPYWAGLVVPFRRRRKTHDRLAA